MELFFNNAGPSIPGDNYMIDPLRRIAWQKIATLIAQKRYFILHAPRQTGKTSCLLALMDYFNQQGTYHALYTNIETAQTARNDIKEGINTVVDAIASAAKHYLEEPRLRKWLQTEGTKYPVNGLLQTFLEYWSTLSNKPVVLFLDEVDALVGDTLISLLRQIRSGYTQRPTHFPISIILCGVRDLKDYRIVSNNQEIITGGSAFNIKATSLTLGNFSQAEVRELWEQHSIATGQSFTETIYPELWEDTQGQPWLVNAIGYELTSNLSIDRTIPITLEHYRTARENIIRSRATHLDQLNDKLKEPRVHRVMSAILSSGEHTAEIPNDDLQYVADLGLITTEPEIRIANRIYQESIPRELIWTRQVGITHQQAWYLTDERRINMPKLLAAFQHYFREQGESWVERFSYKEAGPQLLLQAFLQRIINGGGRITREYGLGRKRVDLFIEWPIDEQHGYQGDVQRIVIELKIRYQSLTATLEKGLPQTAAYADQCAADQAHLMIFDRRTDITSQAKTWHKQHPYGTHHIDVWGL